MSSNIDYLIDKMHSLELDLETLRGDVKMLMEVVWRGEQVIEELQQELAISTKERERQQQFAEMQHQLMRQRLMNQASYTSPQTTSGLTGGLTGGI